MLGAWACQALRAYRPAGSVQVFDSSVNIVGSLLSKDCLLFQYFIMDIVLFTICLLIKMFQTSSLELRPSFI